MSIASEDAGSPSAESKGPTVKTFWGRDLTSGSIPKNLWSLAWPQMVEGTLGVLDQFADIIWAGRIGAKSIAGLGVAQSYTMMAMTGRMGFDTAMRAMIARAVGARNLALANHVTLQAFTLSGIYSVIMVIIGVFLTEPMMRLLGLSEDVVIAGSTYMRVLFVSQGTFAFRMMSGAALQACGDAVTPMKATMVVRVVHITLGPCLAFGVLFFPEMGLSGLAVANAGAQLLGVAMNFHALFTGKSMLHLSLKNFRLDLPIMWQLIKLGAPASAATAERTVAQLVLFGLVARFGDYAVAAFTIVNRTDLLSMMAGMGIGQASGIIAGQCLGAGQPERAKKTVHWAIAFSVVSHFVLASILFAFPEFFASLFSNQQEFLGTTAVWLRIQAIGLVFMGINVVLMTTLNTVGDTVVAMLVTLFALWGVQQPLALILPDYWNLGVYGIGCAMVLAMVSRVAIFVPYFRSGRWLKRNPLQVRSEVGL